jgi:hypothetical protein
MTRVRVDADAVGALGEAVTRLALELRDCAVEAADGSWAVGRGASARALTQVLGDFEHQRLVLGRHLDELGRLAQAAGALYAEVETNTTTSLVGGPW